VNRPLEGKVVLVTGAGIRLGRAIALELGHAGAEVAVHHHRSSEGAEDTVRALEVDGSRSRRFGADLTRDEELVRLVEEVESTLGPIHALVNSAAVFHRKPFLETPPELLDGQWALNTRAPYRPTQEVARRMVARGGGEVVNVLDVGGALNAWKDYSAYCMTKAALAMLTRCLAVELAPAIRVNGVAPGTVLPPESLSPEELESLRRRIPQQTFGTPEDVAQTVRFLLTGPRFLTGQIVAVDGGRSIGLGRG
jgi:NAD(P)-dependent dehydrogenase (short-subunit alcohol dehydrogenase family)